MYSIAVLFGIPVDMMLCHSGLAGIFLIGDEFYGFFITIVVAGFSLRGLFAN